MVYLMRFGDYFEEDVLGNLEAGVVGTSCSGNFSGCLLLRWVLHLMYFHQDHHLYEKPKASLIRRSEWTRTLHVNTCGTLLIG